MNPRALIAAAAVLVIALTPSVADCIEAHQSGFEHVWLLWAWIVLAVIIAVLFGEEMMSRG